MNTIDALKLYKKDLEKIIIREEKKIQKEYEKNAARYSEIMAEYPTEDDVMNAYGYAMITEIEKNKLLEIIEKGRDNGPLSNPYVDMLRRDLKSINDELNYSDDLPTICVNRDPRVEELEKEIERLKAELKSKSKSKSKKHNERGAGRKSIFTEQEKTMIKMYRIQKKTIAELAEMYNCSTGLIHKIINE